MGYKPIEGIKNYLRDNKAWSVMRDNKAWSVTLAALGIATALHTWSGMQDSHYREISRQVRQDVILTGEDIGRGEFSKKYPINGSEVGVSTFRGSERTLYFTADGIFADLNSDGRISEIEAASSNVPFKDAKKHTRKLRDILSELDSIEIIK